MPSLLHKPVHHIGFAGAVKKVEASGKSAESAKRIIGYAKAHASATARRRNPALNNTAKKRS